MRILVVNYEYPPIGGGGGFVTRDILEYMADHGHDVTLITSQFAESKKKERINGVNIHRVPVILRHKIEIASMVSMLSFLPSSVLSTICEYKENDFDIVNTHFAIPTGPAGFCIAKFLKIPNVLSVHGGDIYDPSKSLSPHRIPLLSLVVEFGLNNADCVVAQSQDTKNNTYKHYNFKDKIEIIPLGIKKPFFSKKTRNDFGFNDDDFLICSIGRLIKRKDLENGLKVLAETKENNMEFKFIVIGDGPEKNRLKMLAAELKLSDKVIFMGNVSDDVKFQVLSNSDIYFSSALHEGFGLVFLEAMECGLPVLCYDKGGHNDFLINGRSGFLVRLGDFKSMAGKLSYLMNHKKERKKMGQFNKQVIKKYYIDTCAEKYLILFRNIIEINA